MSFQMGISIKYMSFQMGISYQQHRVVIGCFGVVVSKKPTDLSEEELVEKISKQQAKRGQEDVKMGEREQHLQSFITGYQPHLFQCFSMFFNLTFSALISCLYF